MRIAHARASPVYALRSRNVIRIVAEDTARVSSAET